MTKCSKVATALVATVAVSVQSVCSLAANKDVAFMGLKGGLYDINGLNKDGESFFQQLSKVGTAQGFTTENENADTGMIEVSRPDDGMINPYVEELEEETETESDHGGVTATESQHYQPLCAFENTHEWCPYGYRIPMDTHEVCHQPRDGHKDCNNCCVPWTDYLPCPDDCGTGKIPTGERFCLVNDDYYTTLNTCEDQCCKVDTTHLCRSQSFTVLCKEGGFVPEDSQSTCVLDDHGELDCSVCCVYEVTKLCGDYVCQGKSKNKDGTESLPCHDDDCEATCCEIRDDFKCKNSDYSCPDDTLIPPLSTALCGYEEKTLNPDCSNCCVPDNAPLNSNYCSEIVCDSKDRHNGIEFCFGQDEGYLDCKEQCCELNPAYSCELSYQGDCPDGTNLNHIGECGQMNGNPVCTDETCCTSVAQPCSSVSCTAPFRHNGVELCVGGSTDCQDQCCERDPNWYCNNQPPSSHNICPDSAPWISTNWCHLGEDGKMDCSTCCGRPVTCGDTTLANECDENAMQFADDDLECNSPSDCSNCCVFYPNLKCNRQPESAQVCTGNSKWNNDNYCYFDPNHDWITNPNEPADIICDSCCDATESIEIELDPSLSCHKQNPSYAQCPINSGEWKNENYCRRTEFGGALDCSDCCGDPVTCGSTPYSSRCDSDHFYAGDSYECKTDADCSNCCIPWPSLRCSIQEDKTCPDSQKWNDDLYCSFADGVWEFNEGRPIYCQSCCERSFAEVTLYCNLFDEDDISQICGDDETIHKYNPEQCNSIEDCSNCCEKKDNAQLQPTGPRLCRDVIEQSDSICPDDFSIMEINTQYCNSATDCKNCCFANKYNCKYQTYDDVCAGLYEGYTGYIPDKDKQCTVGGGGTCRNCCVYKTIDW